MQIISEKLYEAMICDIEKSMHLNLPLLVRIECSFRIAEQYNQLLQEQLSLYTFVNQVEEINFFKLLQPAFLAETAYYCLLNYAHNFCPSTLDEQVEFWKRQSGRLVKFQQKHAAFYSYYSNDQTQMDSHYYTQPLPESYPKLVGDLIARKRYSCYSEEQILKLEEKLI